MLWLLFPIVVVRYLEDGSADNDQFVAITSEAFTEESARELFAGVLKLMQCASRQASLKPEVRKWIHALACAVCVAVIPEWFLNAVTFANQFFKEDLQMLRLSPEVVSDLHAAAFKRK